MKNLNGNNRKKFLRYWFFLIFILNKKCNSHLKLFTYYLFNTRNIYLFINIIIIYIIIIYLFI